MSEETRTPVDLKPFLRAMGGKPTKGYFDVPEREEPETPAELIDPPEPVRITTTPINHALFLDGTQSATVVHYRNHRPITLVGTAAAAINQDMTPTSVIETLQVFCAEEDHQWVTESGCPVPVTSITNHTAPVAVERATGDAINQLRNQQEIELTTNLLNHNSNNPDTWVFADGALAERPTSNQLIGVVKTVDTRLLTDESILWGLPEGYRSPRFTLPPNYGGPSDQRYSCYLRLRNATNQPWGYGLIRLESFNPDLLDTAAATALAYRQPAGTLDSRGDRHLAPIAYAERWMRSRRSIYL